MAHFFTSDKEKTFQYQNSLPPLPAPDLENTLKKYLESGQCIWTASTQADFFKTSVKQIGKF